MSREEKINKILEMSKEIIEVLGDTISDLDIDRLYITTKSALQSYKELYEEIEEEEND